MHGETLKEHTSVQVLWIMTSFSPAVISQPFSTFRVHMNP